MGQVEPFATVELERLQHHDRQAGGGASAEVHMVERQAEGGPLPIGEALAALDRVLASPSFRRAGRSRDFLAYVVTETAAGRGERLSERTVGRHALGRDAGFDGRASAAVRVRAGRVRQALEAYYDGEGRDDPVRITVPPGRYAAVIEAAATVPREPAVVPGVAVTSWTSSGGGQAGALAISLAESLTHHLRQYTHLRVVGPTGPGSDVRATGAATGVTTVLVGHVAERNGAAKLSVRLHDTSTGSVLWSDEHLLAPSMLVGFEGEGTWSREIAAVLGDATGLVVRQELVSPRQSASLDEAAARLAFSAYVDRGTVASLEEAVAALDTALATGHRHADLLAMRAAAANAAQIYGLIDRDAGLEQAATLAREALTIDGRNAHAHLVLGSVAHYRGQWDLAIEHAETAVEIAPLHPSYLVGAGITLCGAGAWDRGAGLIQEAHRLHPGLAAHTRTWLAAGHLVHADHARALGEANRLPSDGGFVWGPLYRAMALAGLGHLEQAKAEAAIAASIRPEVVADPEGFFSGRMRLTDEQLAHLVDLVRLSS